MIKGRSQPGVYEWRGKIYIGQKAVAEAAGVTQGVVSWHLNTHGHLDRIGLGPSNAHLPRRPVDLFGRSWPAMSEMARALGLPLSPAKAWLDKGHTDRLLAALMAADARKTDAAMREAKMIDDIRKDAA